MQDHERGILGQAACSGIVQFVGEERDRAGGFGNALLLGSLDADCVKLREDTGCRCFECLAVF